MRELIRINLKKQIAKPCSLRRFYRRMQRNHANAIICVQEAQGLCKHNKFNVNMAWAQV